MRKTLFYLTLFLLASLGCKKNNVVDSSSEFVISGFEPKMGSAGDTLTVFGSGFDRTTTVNVNGTEATVVDVKNQTLRVQLPESAPKGKVTVQKGGQSAVSEDFLRSVVSLKGNITGNVRLTADKQYLLVGQTVLKSGSRLKIEPGTVIFADKDSKASLTVQGGARLVASGTGSQPVIFTSNQDRGRRLPGDWKGIVINGQPNAASDDSLQFVRIEYAGNHSPRESSGALILNKAMAPGTIDHVQISYSDSDGFRFTGAPDASGAPYGIIAIRYLLALGCAGNDFAFLEGTSVAAQFLYGVKDLNYADPLGANGLLVRTKGGVDVSNMTLIGYDQLGRDNGRGINNLQIGGQLLPVISTPRNQNAGRGVLVQSVDGTDPSLLRVYNSLVASSFLCGVSFDGEVCWNAFAGTELVINSAIFNSFIAQPPRVSAPTQNLGVPTDFLKIVQDNDLSYPRFGRYFSGENITSSQSGFSDPRGSAQVAALERTSPGFLKNISVSRGGGDNNAPPFADDLGIINLVDFSQLGRGVITPAQGSPLLSASFKKPVLSPAGSFFEQVDFVGAAGNLNWANGWASFNPQSLNY